MNRIQKVPIKLAKYSHRIEDRCLANHRPGAVLFDLKLQPGPAGQAHFCRQSQQVVALDLFNTPEINCIPRQEPIRVTSAATHTRTAEQQVQQPPNLPEPISVVPASLTAQPLDGSKGNGRRTWHVHRPRIHNPAAQFGPTPRVCFTERRKCAGPARFGKVLILIDERSFQSFTVTKRANREQSAC